MFSGDFCEFLRLYAALLHSCLCSFPLANLQEGERCQIYTNIYSSFSKHLEFSQYMIFKPRFKSSYK